MVGLKSAAERERETETKPSETRRRWIIKSRLSCREEKGRMGNSHKGSDTSRQDHRCLCREERERVRIGQTGRRAEELGSSIFAHILACGEKFYCVSIVYVLRNTFDPANTSSLRRQSWNIFDVFVDSTLINFWGWHLICQHFCS